MGRRPVIVLEGLLAPPGTWRLRAHARGRDEGHAAEGTELVQPLEEHLLQFWLAPAGIGDVVMGTRDAIGARLRRR